MLRGDEDAGKCLKSHGVDNNSRNRDICFQCIVKHLRGLERIVCPDRFIDLY